MPVTRCDCKRAKPTEVREDRFEPLWGDVPAESYVWEYCERCGGEITPWRAVPVECVP